MKNILVVDDEISIRKLLYRQLSKAGYGVASASDGKEAIQVFNEQPVDVVVTDIFMPEKDGLELIIELKERSSSIKIIAISGSDFNSSGTHYLRLAKKLGADKTFRKPVDFDDLSEGIQNLLGWDEKENQGDVL